jgi:8-oxo-dGTP pyrophosphatase MutT (NUDIX family)
MRAQEFVTEDDSPTRLKLGNNNAARAWIEKVYATYPQQFQNNHVMPMGGTGDDQQFAMFELVPSFSKRNAVEVKWFQAYPLRAGVGSRAMKELQAMAREDGISLTLFPWDKGQVSQSKLTKFYKGQGFTPSIKGSKSMQWDPSVNESAEPQAAGCVIVAEDTGRWCLQQRSDTVTDPGVWSTWGGGREPGETLEQTVRRELAEEGGYAGPVQLTLVDSRSRYATFVALVPREFQPQINHESQAWCWCEPDQLPEPLHPELKQLLSVQLQENIYNVLEPYQCGPFDGGCVMVAQALQQIHGGRIVVLVDANNSAQHAAVAVNNQLIDYDGAADIKDFVSRFEQNERVNIQGIRPIRKGDLPDAPRDAKLISRIVQALSENFADGKNPGRKGLSKRVGIPQKVTLGQLQKIASSSTGERRRMAQWQLNMRRGKAKKNT